MPNHFLRSKVQQVYVLAALLLVIKLCLLPFAQTVHADAVSRVFLSQNWMEDPSWLSTDAWPPLHFYLNGFVLSLWNHPIYAPKLLNIILSCLTLIPFFHFTRREFNENGAFVAVIFFAISPIIFRNSFQALAGTPYLLCVALAINWLSKSLKENRSVYAVLAGIGITVAGGFRYDAWLISALLWLVVVWKKEWKLSFIYGFPAIIFPMVWIISNWIQTGNPLEWLAGNRYWTMDMMDNNASLDLESYLRRLWFWPFSLFIALGAPAFYYTIKMIVTSYRINKSVAAWSIPFWIFLAFMIYNSFVGTLVLQHRFVANLVILSLPFIALYFHDLSQRRIKQAVIFGALTVSLSFIYNTDGVIPLPRLHDQTAVIISETIEENLDPNAGLILDFIGWDRTYFLALNSGLSQPNMQITEGATNSKLPLEGIERVLSNFNHGVILLRQNSELANRLGKNIDLSILSNSKNQFTSREIYRDEETVVYGWKRLH